MSTLAANWNHAPLGVSLFPATPRRSCREVGETWWTDCHLFMSGREFVSGRAGSDAKRPSANDGHCADGKHTDEINEGRLVGPASFFVPEQFAASGTNVRMLMSMGWTVGMNRGHKLNCGWLDCGWLGSAVVRSLCGRLLSGGLLRGLRLFLISLLVLLTGDASY